MNRDGKRRGSLHGKYPDGSALRNLRIFSRKQRVQPRLHGARIYAPARLDRDVLFAIDNKGRRLSDDAGVRREFPQELASRRVEGVKHSIVGPAAEYQSSGGDQHRPPVRRLRVRVRPHALAGVHISSLHFADVIGAGSRL